MAPVKQGGKRKNKTTFVTNKTLQQFQQPMRSPIDQPHL